MARQSSRLAAKRNTSNLDQSRRTIEKLDLGVASNDSKVKKMKSEAKAQANTAAKTKGKAKKPRVPPKKRVKTEAETVQLVIVDENASETRGLLQRFMKEAPLDIMLEIFTHLHPKDLLNLARTSKDLRSVLLSKTSAQVWRAVLRNARLPPLPKDLSEPEYASLAFDTWCNVCGGGNCETISWQCRIRCHKTCAAKRLYPFDKLKKLPTWSEGIEEMVDLGFFASIIPRVMISVNEKDIFRGRHFWPLGWIWISYYTPYIIEQFRLEFLEVKDDAERLAQWKGKKTEEYVELSSYEIVWRKWSQRRLSVGQRKTVTGDLREERINEILKKLVALGWNEHNLERTFQLIQHPLVNQSKRLTGEEWEQIKMTVVEAATKVLKGTRI